MSAAALERRVPLAQLADQHQLAASFERLRPGASLIFARGPHPLGADGNATLAMVQAWVRDGLATMAHGRDPELAGQWIYRVYRAAAEAAPPQSSVVVPSEADRVYRLLCRVAERGEPCPTNARIAEALGMESHEQARHRFRQIERARLIRVIEPNRFGTRVIEICATGARTGHAG